MKRLMLGAGLIVLSGCGGNGGTGDAPDGPGADASAPTRDAGAVACPRSGTVIASLRDVERDAEGVSYSVFGEYPKRVADWTRASGVLSLLKGVWADTKTACPDLPSKAVSKVEGAIAILDMAVPAKDQKSAARAANDIHLQMEPLFAFFNPDVPTSVVRMDATFLRAGIDAHFGDFTSYSDDLAVLQSDWRSLRDAAVSKVPKCHRVAGTQSVAGDLDDTLQRMKDAAGTQDVAAIETESDAGLLEVDILELLFDCPPDGKPPADGLGSKCTKDSDCGDGLVCDLANSGGRCAPSPDVAKVGAPCGTTVDCGTDGRAACNNEVGDGFPGGYCSMEPCDDVQVCVPGGTCVALPFETPACLQSCTQDADCRESDGYVCQLFPTTPPQGFGPTDHACAFPCAKDEDCTSPLTCDVKSGKCKP